MTFLKDCLRGQISLTHLTIQCFGLSRTVTTGFLWSILREFKDLEEFWFWFEGDDDGFGRRREIPRSLRCDKLRRLGIRGAVIEDRDIERLKEISPSIKELDINEHIRDCTGSAKSSLNLL
jgi:hypothetical protein